MDYGATNPDDEDFRSRYPTTVGMPANLAKIASGNLAVQDLATAKVNAAGRLSALPGVGAVGSTPATDTTNLSVAAAMERADLADRSQPLNGSTTQPSLTDTHIDDISARRSQLAEQKQQLMSTLATTRMDDHKQRNSILQTWHALDTEDKNLLQEHQIASVAATKDAHEKLVRQTHIQASNGLSKIINGIAGIDEPMGSDAQTMAALKILGDTNDPDIAAARGTPGFDKILGPYASQARKSALTAQRIKEATDNFKTATGRDPASVEVTSSGGINIRSGSVVGDGTKIPQAAYTDLGRLNAQKASDTLYLQRETVDSKKAQLQKSIDATQAKIDAWHQTYAHEKTTKPAVLDTVVAQSILKEAGGDKEKARALAKQRGFQF